MKNACNCGQKVEIQYGPNGKPKAMLIWLCVDELFRTDGTTTYIPDVRDVPELRKLGPMIGKMRIWHQAEGAGADFRMQATISWSITGLIWSTPTVIYAGQAGNGQWPGAWFNIDSNFGPNIRISLDVSNANAGNPQVGRLTVALEVELKG